MELTTLLLLLLLLLTLVWLCLLWKGIDPVRLVRSVFKSPRHYLTPSSYAERAKLLRQAQLVPPGARTDQALLYSEAMGKLADASSSAEIEELVHFLYATRLVNTDVKAQHFAQHCQRKLPLHALSAATLSVIIMLLHRYVKFQGVAETIQSCFEAATGRNCFELKIELERHLSIHRLVFQRIRFSCVRDAIITHLEQEAASLLSDPDFVRPLKVICDIDDTMISVLFDTRYPDLTVYPGVHQFVEELLHCELNSSSSSSDCRPRLTFLTARPDIMRRRSVRELRASGFFHFNLLMGRLSHVVLGSRRIAAGKLENFENFRRLFTEYQFIFVGDNGQGDIDLGKDLLSDPAKYGVSLVLIHDVVRNHVRSARRLREEGILVESFRRRECDAHGIILFQTYISAVAQLYEHGIVDEHAVLRVLRKTTAAHAAITYESELQRETVTREIANDIAMVIKALPEIHAESVVDELSSEVKAMLQEGDELVIGDEDKEATDSLV